jgi:hypothetical protein
MREEGLATAEERIKTIVVIEVQQTQPRCHPPTMTAPVTRPTSRDLGKNASRACIRGKGTPNHAHDPAHSVRARRVGSYARSIPWLRINSTSASRSGGTSPPQSSSSSAK